jgi:hypothetical protein
MQNCRSCILNSVYFNNSWNHGLVYGITCGSLLGSE